VDDEEEGVKGGRGGGGRKRWTRRRREDCCFEEARRKRRELLGKARRKMRVLLEEGEEEEEGGKARRRRGRWRRRRTHRAAQASWQEDEGRTSRGRRVSVTAEQRTAVEASRQRDGRRRRIGEPTPCDSGEDGVGAAESGGWQKCTWMTSRAGSAARADVEEVRRHVEQRRAGRKRVYVEQSHGSYTWGKATADKATRRRCYVGRSHGR